MATIVAALNEAGIPHMVAGSSASSFHGEPRTTADIDIVIDPDASSLQRFVNSLQPDRFYVGDAASALARRDLFNVIDIATGWKVDLILKKQRPFSQSEFDRRVLVAIGGVSVYMATAEDTILSKLEYARVGGSDRQMRDVAGILAVSGQTLDRAYLAHWADQLAIADDLARAEQLAAE